MKGLIIGSIVHFVMPGGEVRPGIVVRIWDPSGMSNLQVFTDGKNDGGDASALWKTSIHYSAEGKANTWHWPTEPPVAGAQEA